MLSLYEEENGDVYISSDGYGTTIDDIIVEIIELSGYSHIKVVLFPQELGYVLSLLNVGLKSSINWGVSPDKVADLKACIKTLEDIIERRKVNADRKS